MEIRKIVATLDLAFPSAALVIEQGRQHRPMLLVFVAPSDNPPRMLDAIQLDELRVQDVPTLLDRFKEHARPDEIYVHIEEQQSPPALTFRWFGFGFEYMAECPIDRDNNRLRYCEAIRDMQGNAFQLK
jgi:hypothetical protein